MSHGLRIVNNGQRYQANLLDGVEVVVSAVLTDWYFGVASGVLSGVGNIPSGSAFGSPGLTPNLTIGAIASAEAIGSPTVSTSVLLTNAGGIASSEAAGVPALTASIASGNIASAEVVGSPTVTVTVALSNAGGIAPAEVLGSAVLVAVVVPAGALSAELFGTPNVSVWHAISANGIPTAEELGTPIITVPYPVLPYGIGSDEYIGAPVITLVYVITGVVKDKKGVPVPGADVNLFNAVTHALVHNGVSDSTGRYRATVPDNYTNYFMVAFFGDSPRYAGCTLDNLKGK